MKDIIDMEIIREIESSGDPKAFNKGSGCRGLYQVSEACFSDFTVFHPWHDWEIDDLFKPEVNTFIARWYMFYRLPVILKARGIPLTVARLLASYNWGPGHVIKWVAVGEKLADLPEETRNYIDRYLKEEVERRL